MQVTPGRYLAVAGACVAVVFAIVDPSGSTGLGLPARLLFWFGHVFAALALLVLASRGLARLPRVRRWNPWLSTALAGALGSAAFAPVALALERPFGQVDDGDDDGLAGALSEVTARWGWPGEALAEWSDAVLPVVVVWLLLNAPLLLRLNFSPAAEEVPVKAGWQTRARPLLDQLPAALGTDLVALSSELHYIRVHTQRGNALVLFALRDAIDLLGDLDGLQVHRSHWVAGGHVRRLRRRGNRLECLMSNGLAVPVSRRLQRQAQEVFGERAEYRDPAGDPAESR